MNFETTEDQRQLRDSASRWVREAYALQAWRQGVASERGWSADRWRDMADFGWLGIGIPEAHGGLGLGVQERAIVSEALGSAVALEPYWSTAVLGAQLIQAAATSAQQAEWLPRIASGRCTLAFAALEPGAHHDWRIVHTTARRDGGAYRIDGEKLAVLDAPSADALLLLARTEPGSTGDAGLSLFLVDADTPGLHRRNFPTLDHRRCSDLRLSAAQVPASRRLGEEGRAGPAVARALDFAMAALCTEAVGAMQAALDMSSAYLHARRQFGRPLADFQVLRHRVADMLVALEQARSISAMATASLALPDAQRHRAVVAAKVLVGKSGRFIGESAVQLHGGMGVTEELHIGHYLKRLLALDLLLGDEQFHLKRFSGL